LPRLWRPAARFPRLHWPRAPSPVSGDAARASQAHLVRLARDGPEQAREMRHLRPSRAAAIPRTIRQEPVAVLSRSMACPMESAVRALTRHCWAATGSPLTRSSVMASCSQMARSNACTSASRLPASSLSRSKRNLRKRGPICRGVSGKKVENNTIATPIPRRSASEVLRNPAAS
jgi:hypothetical protein